MAQNLAPAQINTTNNDSCEALDLEHLMGMSCDYTNSFIIHPVDPNTFVHSIGPAVVVGKFDDTHNQSLLKNHDTPISCISVSDCGSMIASGQYGSNFYKDSAIVNLWDYQKLSLIHSFSGLTKKIHQVLFTPDSKFLIGIDFNGLFIIWDTISFETIFAKQIRINNNNINIDSICILDVKSDKSMGKYSKHNIYSIILSYQHNLYKYTLMYSVKHMEYILDDCTKFSFPPNRTYNRILTHLSTVRIDHNVDDPDYLIAGTTNIGEVFLFNSKHNIYITSFQASSKGANISCFLSKDIIFVGGGDGKIKQFIFNEKIKLWELVKCINLDSSVNTLQLINNKTILIATTIKSNVYKINISSSSSSSSSSLLLQSPYCSISKISFFNKYNHIFVTLTKDNGLLTLWDLSNYLIVSNIQNNSNSNGCCLLCYKENNILTGFENGSVTCNYIDFRNNGKDTKELWNIQNVHRGKVNTILVCEARTKLNKNQTTLLITGGDDGLLNIWNYNNQQLILQKHLMIESVLKIIKDIEYPEIIHILGNNGQIVTFSLKREDIIIRRMIEIKKYGKLTCMIQSNINEYELISATSTGWIIYFDCELTEMLQAIDIKKLLNLKNLVIISIALSHNSKYLSLGNNIGQIFIMNLETKQIVSQNSIHSNIVSDIAWTPDDKQVIASSNDSSISVSNFYA